MSQINPYMPINAMPAQRDRSQNRPARERRGDGDRDRHEQPHDTLEQSEAAIEAAAEEPNVAALPEKATSPLPQIDLTA